MRESKVPIVEINISAAINESTGLVEIDMRPISVLVKEFLANKELSVKLSSGQTTILNTVLQHIPTIFDDITKSVKAIIADKVIDFSDMPHFVLMAKTIANVNAKELKALKITRRDITDMIEALFIILLEKQIVDTGDKKETYIALLKASMQLLDASIDLDDTIRASWAWCC